MRISITKSDAGIASGIEYRSIFHIYQKHEVHKVISPILDPTKERRSGPTVKEQRAKCKEEKERKKSRLSHVEPDEKSFFLYRPYLAFYVPPRVLYVGNHKENARPVALIHAGPFWRWYRLQVGSSISNVLDPRGVVPRKHNGGDKQALKSDDRKLKGYKVRIWRLWGETGKDYVHSVKQIRKIGRGSDPDMLLEPGFTRDSR